MPVLNHAGKAIGKELLEPKALESCMAINLASCTFLLFLNIKPNFQELNTNLPILSTMMHEEIDLPPPLAHTVVEDFSSKGNGNDVVEAQNVKQVSSSTSVPHASPDFNDYQMQERQGHLCFGCLCDMRRAVIAVNIVSIAIAVFELCMLIVFLVLYDEITSNPDGSGPVGWISVNQYVSKQVVGTAIGVCFLAIAFYAIGIRGASKFNRSMVSTTLMYHCVSGIFNLLVLNIFGLLLSILFAYPHVMLLMALRNGTMSAENYAKEKRGCCM